VHDLFSTRGVSRGSVSSNSFGSLMSSGGLFANSSAALNPGGGSRDLLGPGLNSSDWFRSSHSVLEQLGSWNFPGASAGIEANHVLQPRKPRNAGGRHSRPETRVREELTMRRILAAVTATQRVCPGKPRYRIAAELLAEPPFSIDRDEESLRGCYRNARRKLTIDEGLVKVFEDLLQSNSGKELHQ